MALSSRFQFSRYMAQHFPISLRVNPLQMLAMRKTIQVSKTLVSSYIEVGQWR
jgi:hypothetical protein